MQDTTYWNDYYGSRNAVGYPSPFAEFAQQHLLHDASNILELGSGSGRDSFYFYDNGHQITGLDQATEAIGLCNEHSKGARHPNRITFREADFTRLDPAEHETIDTVYSRFTIHSIDDEAEARLMPAIWDILPSGGQLLIEARTILDPLYGKGDKIGEHEFYTDHYRRHIDAQRFIRQEIDRGYLLRFFHEGAGLAPFKGEDPVVLRTALIKP